MPSESRWESQMKAEATATSSCKPSAGATVAPVTETPGVGAPVTETPSAETPVVETPAAPSDTPAPMETGGAGDGQSWPNVWRPAFVRNSNRIGPRSVTGHNPSGGAKTNASLPPPRQ